MAPDLVGKADKSEPGFAEAGEEERGLFLPLCYTGRSGALAL